ncbi:unnamed protein product, partial [Mesorhabditis spiculigera]
MLRFASIGTFLVTVAVASVPYCPDGTIAYKGNCLHFMTAKNTFNMTQMTCASLHPNATLFGFENKDELSALKMWMPLQVPIWVSKAPAGRMQRKSEKPETKGVKGPKAPKCPALYNSQKRTDFPNLTCAKQYQFICTHPAPQCNQQ